MAVWRFLAAFASLIALGTGVSSGASPAEAVEIFRRGCLDHLPDFDGSEAFFRTLGFVRTEKSDGYDWLRSNTYGPFTKVGLRLNADEPARACSLIIQVTDEAAVTPLVNDVIADLTLYGFRHTVNENGTVEAFSWRIGTLEAVVLLLHLAGQGQANLMAFVGENPEKQE